MIDKIFFFDLNKDEDIESAKERVEMVQKQWEMADAKMIEDRTLKLAVNGKIIHYNITAYSENVLFFKQKVFEKKGVKL